MFELLGCPIVVEQQRMNAIVLTESSGQQYAVGVVEHVLNRQPRSEVEAVQLVKQLKADGINYSVGLAQVNQVNFSKYNLNYSNMFDRCANLSAGSKILKACYVRFKNWDKAYSCYYSGNAVTGFKHGYVQKVRRNLDAQKLKEVVKEVVKVDKAQKRITVSPRNHSKKKKQVGIRSTTLLSRRLAGTNKQNTHSAVEIDIVSRRLVSDIPIN